MSKYTMRKGDKLEVVARKLGHRDWKPIWAAPGNRQLAGKRGKPEHLQPGDVLDIPPNEAELRAQALQRASTAAALATERMLVDVLAKEAIRLPKVILLYEAMIEIKRSYTEETLAELDATAKGIAGLSDSIDAVATFARLGVDLGKLAKGAHGTLSLRGDALRQANDALGQETLKLMRGPLEDAALDAAESLKGQTRRELQALEDLLRPPWGDDFSAPSSWANSVAQRLATGKSFWDHRRTTDLGNDIRAAQDGFAKGTQQDIARIRKRLVELRAQAAEVQKRLAASRLRVRAHEATAASIE